MIVLDTTLVGYQVFNGTWQLQMALLLTTIFDAYMNPDVIIPNLDHHYVTRCRRLCLINHSILFVVLLYQAIDKPERMQGLKLALTFCCMMIALYVLLSVSELNFYSPRVTECPN